MSDRCTLHRFHCDEPLDSGRTFRLSEEITEQLRKVLRLRVDDHIVLFDGSGLEAVASIRSLGPDQATVELVQDSVKGRVPSKPEIYLGLALLKADRFDLVIQKATELGASSIQPISTERSVVSLSADRARNRVARWRRIANEALEQCGRADEVHIGDPLPFDHAIDVLPGTKRLIAWEREVEQSLTSVIDGDEDSIAVIIGPEGGFTEQEVKVAEQAGCIPVSLGELTLRSETAAIAAIAAIRTAAQIRREIRHSNVDD